MAPALQPPSRTATPTPIDALLAPLHLGSPASPPSSPSTAAPGGLRSRKSTTALNTATNGFTSGLLLFGTDTATPSPSSNTTALGIATSVNGGAAGWHSPRRGGLQAADANGKGKARAVEQQHDATLPSQEREREVIVHKVYAPTLYTLRKSAHPTDKRDVPRKTGPQSRLDRVHLAQVRHHGQSPIHPGKMHHLRNLTN